MRARWIVACLIASSFPAYGHTEESYLTEVFTTRLTLIEAQTWGSWSASKGNFKLLSEEPRSGMLAPLITFRKKTDPRDFEISFKWRSSAKVQRLGGQSIHFGLSEFDGECIWFQCAGANFLLHTGNRFQEELSDLARKKPFYKTHRVSPNLCVNPINSYFDRNKWNSVKIIGSHPCLEFWINDELAFSFNIDHEISNISKDTYPATGHTDQFKIHGKEFNNYCNDFYRFVLTEFMEDWKKNGLFMSLEGLKYYDGEPFNFEVKEVLIRQGNELPRPFLAGKDYQSIHLRKVSKEQLDFVTKAFVVPEKGLPSGVVHRDLYQSFGPTMEQKTPGIDYDGLLFNHLKFSDKNPYVKVRFDGKKGVVDPNEWPAVFVDRYFGNGNILLYCLIFKDEKSANSFDYGEYIPYLGGRLIGLECTKPIRARRLTLVLAHDPAVPESTVDWFSKLLTRIGSAAP